VSENKLIIVSPEDDGQRLDRWLKKCVPEIPYGLAQKLIRKGAIKIDGSKGKGDSRLSAGQEVRIPPVEDRPDRAKQEYKLTAEDAAQMRALVLFDDGDVVVLNKPSGLATQGGGGERRHIDGMLKALTNRAGLKPRLIHRLDKETSGVLLLAREPETVRNLGFTFKTRDVKKIYLALCSPAPVPDEGQVRAPVAKARGRIKDKMTIDEEEGKGAVTDFAVIERAEKKAAFVAFSPLTGRTHQIRVHAAEALKAPLVGDDKYARKANADTRIDLEGLHLAPRLHLHAFSLTLPDPRGKGKARLSFTAPLPPELRASWQAFGFDPSWSGDPFPDKPE
jgi:23S rRNA pseudouridine955/2504/2580 synthase